MKSYNRLTRLFLFTVWLCGAIAAGAAFLLFAPDHRHTPSLLLGLLAALAFAAGSRRSRWCDLNDTQNVAPFL